VTGWCIREVGLTGSGILLEQRLVGTSERSTCTGCWCARAEQTHRERGIALSHCFNPAKGNQADDDIEDFETRTARRGINPDEQADASADFVTTQNFLT
jgi:hypothetical protein